MRAFVESLKRLYEKKKLTEDQIKDFQAESKISEEEADYVTGYEAINRI